MISITCCRIGKKGYFVKVFSSLEGFVKFVFESRGHLFFPIINKELTRSQRKQAEQKLESMLRKSLI